jgi:phage baseplate assembly protein W
MTFTPNLYGGPPGSYAVELEEFGRDLLHDGDLVVGAYGDYTTVEGIEHVRRSMIRRILVRPGEYRLRPDYGAGLLAYVKKPLTSSVKAELTARITGQVKKMRQIEKVLDVEITEETQNGTPFIRVLVRAQVLGKRVEFRPFLVAREV